MGTARARERHSYARGRFEAIAIEQAYAHLGRKNQNNRDANETRQLDQSKTCGPGMLDTLAVF